MGRAAHGGLPRGAHVIVTDLDESAAKETATLIEADGGSAEAHQLDVRDLGQITSLFQEVERTHGVLHVLSTMRASRSSGPRRDVRGVRLRVDINLKGAFFVAQAAVDLLKRAEGKGSIIFTRRSRASWALHSAALLDDQGRIVQRDESRLIEQHDPPLVIE